jgi:phenylalanine-4-hydroxylase
LKAKLLLVPETYKVKLSCRFKNCTVTHGETVLFQPNAYDMAVGKVVSAFSGPADANSFDLITNMPSSTTIKAQHSAERDNLEVLSIS